MSGLSADGSAVNTAVKVLQARNPVGRVVSRLDLESDPDLKPTLREGGPLAKARRRIGDTMAGLGGAPSPATSDDPAFRRRQTAIDRLFGARRWPRRPRDRPRRLRPPHARKRPRAPGDRRIPAFVQDVKRLPEGRRAEAFAARFDALFAAAVGKARASRRAGGGPRNPHRRARVSHRVRIGQSGDPTAA